MRFIKQKNTKTSILPLKKNIPTSKNIFHKPKYPIHELTKKHIKKQYSFAIQKNKKTSVYHKIKKML